MCRRECETLRWPSPKLCIQHIYLAFRANYLAFELLGDHPIKPVWLGGMQNFMATGWRPLPFDAGRKPTTPFPSRNPRVSKPLTQKVNNRSVCCQRLVFTAAAKILQMGRGRLVIRPGWFGGSAHGNYPSSKQLRPRQSDASDLDETLHASRYLRLFTSPL